MSTRRAPFQPVKSFNSTTATVLPGGGIELVPPIPEPTSKIRDVLALALMICGAGLSVVAVGVLWGLWIALLVLGVLLVVAGVLVTTGS